jgi:hypothetical protein
VSVLDPLPFRADDQRVEGMVALAGFVDELPVPGDRTLGHGVVRVPALSLQETLAFVLETLCEQRWI